MSVERRTSASGVVSYRVRVYHQHRVVSQRSFELRRDAKRWEADEMARLKSGAWIDPRRASLRFEDLAEQWQESRDHLAVRSQETTRYLLDSYVLPKIGAMPIGPLSATDVEKVLSAINERGLAVATRRRTLSVIRLVLDYGIRDRRLVENVARQVALPRGKVRHEARWLRAEELYRLADAMPEACRPVVLFLGLTGCRFSEMAALRVADVVVTQHGMGVRVHRAAPQSKTTSAAIIGSTKTHQARTMPVPEVLGELIKQRAAQGRPGDYLFASPEGHIWTNTNFRLRAKWTSTVRELGLGTVRIHDLRHTAASLLIASGADVKSVQMILGHASATMTIDLYGHLFSDAPWVAMRRLSAFTAPEDNPGNDLAR